MEKTIFGAARTGDAATVRKHLANGADVAALDEHGLTALHCAAIACNRAEAGPGMAVMRVLLEAGASPDAMSRDGRSAFYMTAEMAWGLEPVKLLLDAGANPDVTDAHGNHVVVNTMTPEVQALLSELTGHPIPAPPPPGPPERKIGWLEWRKISKRLDQAFEELNRNRLVALQDAGYTQDDAFSDCSEECHGRGGLEAGIEGFCFYTRQDLERARETSLLSLGFWGAPEGANESMLRIGEKIVATFRQQGFEVEWNGAADTRPMLLL